MVLAGSGAGDGPERERLLALRDELGLSEDEVAFLGFERRIAEGPIEEEASEADDDEEEMLDGEDADAFEEQAALALRI